MAKTSRKKTRPTKRQPNHLLFGDQWDYAPAPENPDFVQIEESYGHFIGGKFVKGSRHFDVVNPATEKRISRVATAGTKEVNAAVKSARDAYNKYWKKLSGTERAKYIYHIGRAMLGG